MAEEDRRMHEGEKPGLAGPRGHERPEEPVGTDRRPDGKASESAGGTDTADSSALGGDVATRSGVTIAPPETDETSG